ncbi:hypothetical protein Hanom_Chr06g00510241 [Helianthus anomalus]
MSFSFLMFDHFCNVRREVSFSLEKFEILSFSSIRASRDESRNKVPNSRMKMVIKRKTK